MVASEQARFLLVTEPAAFDASFRAASEPAERLEIPPAPSEPPDIAGLSEPPDIAGLSELAASFGVEILGPPGIPA